MQLCNIASQGSAVGNSRAVALSRGQNRESYDCYVVAMLRRRSLMGGGAWTIFLHQGHATGRGSVRINNMPAQRAADCSGRGHRAMHDSGRKPPAPLRTSSLHARCKIVFAFRALHPQCRSAFLLHASTAINTCNNAGHCISGLPPRPKRGLTWLVHCGLRVGQEPGLRQAQPMACSPHTRELENGRGLLASPLGSLCGEVINN